MCDPDSRYEFQSQVSTSGAVIRRLQNRLPAMLSSCIVATGSDIFMIPDRRYAVPRGTCTEDPRSRGLLLCLVAGALSMRGLCGLA